MRGPIQDPGDRWAPWAVFALTLVALAAGWVLRANVEARTRTLSDGASGVSLAVPNTWQGGAGDSEGAGAGGGTTLLSARDPGNPRTSVRVTVIDLGDRKLENVQRTYVFQLGEQLKAFRVVGAPEPVQVAGDTGVRFAYAYVEDPAASNPQSRQYPVVIAAGATLIARGGALYILTTATDATQVDANQALLDRIVQSVHLP